MSDANTPRPPSLDLASRRAAMSLEPVRSQLGNRPQLVTSTALSGDDMDGSLMRLPVMSVKTYDKNPRTEPNPLYREIKESIRLHGITQTISVTRRPGATEYICAAGGNTRLTAQQELFAESGAQKYAEIDVRYRSWRGEIWLLASHLGENHTHGSTTYWDDVCAVVRLRDLMEAESNTKLTSTELHTRVALEGCDFGLRDIKYMLFAHESLAPLGQHLTSSATKSLQPAITSLQALAAPFGIAQKLPGVFREALESYAAVLPPEPDEGDKEQRSVLSVPDVINVLKEAFGNVIGSSREQVEQMLIARAENPRISLDELRKPRVQPSRRGKDLEAHQSSAQMPLAGGAVLSPVSTGIPATAHTASKAPSPGPSSSAHAPAPAPTAAATHRVSDPRTAAYEVIEVLKQITLASQLHDCVASAPTMPLGFYLDLPPTGLATVDGVPAADPAVRRAAWLHLATLSGQFEPAFLDGIDGPWRELAQNRSTLASTVTSRLDMPATQGSQIDIPAEDLSRIVWHPVLGKLFAQLWTWIAQWRELEPERFAAFSSR